MLNNQIHFLLSSQTWPKLGISRGDILGRCVQTMQLTDVILGSFKESRRAESNGTNVISVGHLVEKQYAILGLISPIWKCSSNWLKLKIGGSVARLYSTSPELPSAAELIPNTRSEW